MTVMIPQCLNCKHYRGGLQCKAFPKKIPYQIFNCKYDHRKSFDGDNGIRYEPQETEENM